ncbi:hypothetical protein N7532_010575 [Penicillium argentinense]|uniref:C2 NT-type domain-containing protein n=1 Tax=Penicillium argentinense TaxID=1131581 RepID=A0A9W9EQ14_9EURO|nr:uncharacterized protein N7532_010575 [Penicillium argentinense]KAJ5085804.1 hypothetical protein N7532_010575 [Penicillium argentinense]
MQAFGNGVAWVRWRLPSAVAAEHQGHTEKATLSDHRAYWNYEKSLTDCDINFEIIQEFHNSSEKNVLGKIKLNLAEYVDKVEEDEGVVRRYLMFDSKVNSTVKIGIAMRQIEGDRVFTTPHLKSATVFGGIAGVVHSSEPVDSDELGQMPSINTKSRETADMQDLYRRTLAASWTSRSCDLPADKMIEELFSGGGSWNIEAHNFADGDYIGHDSRDAFLDPEAGARKSRSGKRLSPSLSPGFERRPKSSSSNHSRGSAKTPEPFSTLGHPQKSGSIEQQLYDGAKGRGWKSRHAEHELSEFDVREDLRSWEVGSNN